MPSINIIFLNLLKKSFQQYPIFIESGTYIGDTIFEMENYFDELHTIELSNHHYELTKKKYNGNKINFYLGESSDIFVNLLPKINKPAIFFLDGHWSSGNTARGSKDCPLIEEISNIKKYFDNEGIIIIDDRRLFGKSKITGHNENWSDISEDSLLSILGDRVIDYYFLDSECAANDRFIIHVGNKQ
jgi:hypothetical protein